MLVSTHDSHASTLYSYFQIISDGFILTSVIICLNKCHQWLNDSLEPLSFVFSCSMNQCHLWFSEFSEPFSSVVQWFPWTQFICGSVGPLNHCHPWVRGSSEPFSCVVPWFPRNHCHVWFNGYPEPLSSVVQWFLWANVICALAVFINTSSKQNKKDARQTIPR